MRWILRNRRFLAVSVSAIVLGTGANALLSVCGPFTDVAADAFCPFVREIFYLGITTGTTPTTYDPSGNVTRLQMAAFLSRTVDAAARRSSRRLVLERLWFPVPRIGILGSSAPRLIKSDGADLWIAIFGDGSVIRMRASDFKYLETWTGATAAVGVLVEGGGIFITGSLAPGVLYGILPSMSAGAVTTLTTNLGDYPAGIAFDGAQFWTANVGSVTRVYGQFPWTATTVSAGFSAPLGLLYDGASIWATDQSLLRLDPVGGITQTVTVGSGPQFPVFDGSNIWVPNAGSNSVSVVRASTGVVLATLSGNGLNGPTSAAFDGERILVTNPAGDSASLWRASDLAAFGVVQLPANSGPYGACSDGLSFWVTKKDSNSLGRF